MQCIVPPYMVERIEAASSAKKNLFDASVHTRFNDALFRKKRALLNAMSVKEMMRIVKAWQAETIATKNPGPKTSSPTPQRRIYDAGHAEDQRSLPGKLVRGEGQKASKDKDVNNIYENCGYTWEFYYAQLQRNSIDDKGLPLINSVHFGTNYGNAFWEGTQMVYGDGDNVFRSFTEDIDITGHELTHGVVQYTAKLNYSAQSGALNESIADVFGIMIKQYALKQDARTATWLIGERCMKGKGYALRSLKSPGTAYRNHPVLGDDPQPATMKDYKRLPDTANGDYGGVHLNSGIPNHAFYLVAYNLGGNSWEKAGKIWYDALTTPGLLHPDAQFADLRNATVTTAEKRFGLTSAEAGAVKQAWTEVGV